ncbi:malto-oligosyltrehalose trehalohydrolase [Agrobacterium rosae]|uniref:Malto-oligosyltrehalose trehalohydrolase n=1 Tax=Agrobacterium rosae TaxID=1972867 RepID=A0AAE5VMM5_9HYPH|nr:malto-oligosyltrehalose trehalohydrolase [Agrobacterium rosae]KAA3511653.1 malto-oligosyltrehalose trehalohydrolase [Agrobacterium rosae]KAA3518925.1 malto-oligosyltrehalose trehalohydrolase [Agrobacterium rosae]MCM2435167.1 malto-oligosyltrehalose trehalohydrolase [Agrobacterium rosae]MDX8314195.1 malto-oligosyltrehalose trehalohydrolase [Agrobacterium rosae]MDX8331098.1 malto-oligosyltrehalose trehalohydrolase [Agrobacterium rosae]
MLDELAVARTGSETRSTLAWGAQLIDGGTRFRLWAPNQKQVKLRLSGDHLMTRSQDGWFEIFINEQPFGSSYGFVLDDGSVVSDPASRRQQSDVSSLSILTDPNAYQWKHREWRGRPWHEAVIYEIHIGTFTPEGTFNAAAAKLDHLKEIGVTAIEILPLAHFPGARGWGYDGVLQYAPHTAYGTPNDLKALIDIAHGLGLMVFLDVVYNHFGPEGNFLSQYAPEFFRDKHNDWGQEIAFERQPVRRYFTDNALYWLEEFRLDGLRFDAVNEVKDDSSTHILEEIPAVIRKRLTDRTIHLMIENPPNGTDLLANGLFTADWNDGFHHVVHRIVTGETSGIFDKFADTPFDQLRKIAAEGYVDAGEPTISKHLPPTASLPSTSFIHFLQNHDQVGNRALGDRLHTTIDDQLHRALTALLLLSPQIPLLFMGDSYRDNTPFHFFADYKGELASTIRDNRAPEAENFGGYPKGFSADDIPDPNAEATFLGSKIDWAQLETEEGRAWSGWLKRLIAIRQAHIAPNLADAGETNSGTVLDCPAECVFVDWTIGKILLQLRLNLSKTEALLDSDLGKRIWPETADGATDHLPPMSVAFYRRDISG